MLSARLRLCVREGESACGVRETKVTAGADVGLMRAPPIRLAGHEILPNQTGFRFFGQPDW